MSVILLLHTILMVLTFGNFELLTVDYNSIDEPIVELNNHTLREVFEGGNLVVNGEFSNGFTSWSTSNISGDTQITEQKLKTFSTTTTFIVQNITINTGVNIYVRFNIEVSRYVSGSLGLRLNNYGSTINNLYSSTTLGQKIVSNNILTTGAINQVWFGNSLIANADTYYDNLYIINRDALGISSLTVFQMDNYFAEYQANIGADDVTYTINEHDMTDLIILLGFGFLWVGIFWILRKVVS